MSSPAIGEQGDRLSSLCGLRFLGLTMEHLIDRLGRPCVKAAPGGTADGYLMRNPPVRAAMH